MSTMIYFIILSVLYGLAAILLLTNKRMSRGILLMLVSPLAATSVLYAFAIFVDVPHWSFILGQACYLLAIIVISIFERRDLNR